eukprot:COSAG01_NODE_59663_length_299_cov_0.735000_1_plen_78_part_10
MRLRGCLRVLLACVLLCAAVSSLLLWCVALLWQSKGAQVGTSPAPVPLFATGALSSGVNKTCTASVLGAAPLLVMGTT